MPTPNQKKTPDSVGRIRDALRKRGTSLNAWAAAHDYRPRTVYDAVQIWGDRTDRAPLGGISRSIMADLRADLGPEILPVPAAREAA